MAAEQDPEGRAAARPLLTDLYQATMALGYWRAGRAQEAAEFELFFRRCPFGGAFALAAGLRDCVRFVRAFRLTDADVQFLASVLPPDTDPAFFQHLRALDCSGVTVRALPEGSLAFPSVPLLQVSGPLLVVQLLETPLLCLVGYASLIATNAARLRLIAGPEKRLLELGLRRAQGPDGGLTASTYSYLGGFDGSSNMLAGQLRGVPVAGTLAHSFITSFSGTEVPPDPMLAPAAGQGPRVDLAACVETWLERVCGHLGLGVQEPHRGERAAFVAYALAFPRAFQGLLDTYSVQRSGLPNFLAVALALEELGYQAVGVRLDSGDLLQQAQETRGVFRTVADQFRVPWLESIPIAVSNNIDEQELARLSQKGSEVNVIGIGTSVVTCPRQPSLGCVYKLVSVGGQPRMKLTEDPEKQTLPGSKAAFRLLGSDGALLLDVLQLAEEPPPQAGQELRVWPRGTQESCTVRPVHVEPLLRLWVQQGQLCEPLPSLAESRAFAQQSLSRLSPAHRRLEQPALYQVALSEKLRALVDRLSAEPATHWTPRASHGGLESGISMRVHPPREDPSPARADSPEFLGRGGPRRPGVVHGCLSGRGWLCGNAGDSTHPVLSPGGPGGAAGGPGARPCARAAGTGAQPGGVEAPAGGPAGAEHTGPGAPSGRGVSTAATLTAPGPGGSRALAWPEPEPAREWAGAGAAALGAKGLSQIPAGGTGGHSCPRGDAGCVRLRGCHMGLLPASSPCAGHTAT
ncbi:nicotinate phosphoribosyltransferase isoform X7 [Monodon monoceros]|uniref:Nicotinate phosphoribosyltransferase n=1 Tax=Monodon monoceros TaxID=40151 RepID=A0A8C6CAX0_MONMO|nr:nicotinate phosphoribosyltransferase isoform X7 [Monodon monoceros]